MNNINYLSNLSTFSFHYQINDLRKAASFRLILTVNLLAISVLSFSYLAYQQPLQWCKVACSIIVTQLYLLPKILRYASVKIIGLSLLINFSAMQTLFLSGISVSCFCLTKDAFIYLKNKQPIQFFIYCYLITFSLGYLAPFCEKLFEKIHDLLIDSQERDQYLRGLYETFHHRPQVGLGLLQTNLWKGFILQFFAIAPDYLLNKFLDFPFLFPSYAWTIAANKQNFLKVFEKQIEEMKNHYQLVSFENPVLPLEKKLEFEHLIDSTLSQINKEQLPNALSFLLLHQSFLVPHIISERFLFELLLEENNWKVVNQLRQNFLNSTLSWEEIKNNFESLNLQTIDFENEVRLKLSSQMNILEDEKHLLIQKHTEINHLFSDLRKKLQTIYFENRVWEKLIPLLEKNLIADHKEHLLDELKFEIQLTDFNIIYDHLFKKGKEAKNLNEKIEYINRQCAASIDKMNENENFSISEFLGGHGVLNDHHFVVKDYQDLTTWLKLTSPNDIDEGLKKIGLTSQKDLYRHSILSPHEKLSKEKVRQNLQDYIKKNNRFHFFKNRLITIKNSDGEILSPLINKVKYAVYYAVDTGIILVPVFINPFAAKVGFGIGICYCTLKRFNIFPAKNIEQAAYLLITDHNRFLFIFNFFNRRIFYIDAARQNKADAFFKANFFKRMRMINLDLMIAFSVSFIREKIEDPWLGSLAQGVNMAWQLNDLLDNL